MVSFRSNARLLRFGIFALVLLFCFYVLSKGSSYHQSNNLDISTLIGGSIQKGSSEGAGAIGGGSVGAGSVGADSAVAMKSLPPGKVKAAFVTLARNEDLNELAASIEVVEERFNKNYHYDWVFLNEVPFTDTFKDAISRITSGSAQFGVIPTEYWSYPNWIDKEKAALAREELFHQKVIYGHSESYRHMCRFEAGFFFRHELLDDYEYYWRVEPGIQIYCDIDYDVFQFMKDEDKWYGWVISVYEYAETMPTLWDTTKRFLKENPKYISKNNNMQWITDDNGETYNGCHFWSNFEIGRLDFWRSEAYMKYFEYLDQAGGFFYERWGDAPVHSIAASLFMPKNKIHFFHDVGYFHPPFHNCPIDEGTRSAKNCVCDPELDITWRWYSCTPRFFTLNGLKRPTGWENFTS